jgi:hypothetical protein
MSDFIQIISKDIPDWDNDSKGILKSHDFIASEFSHKTGPSQLASKVWEMDIDGLMKDVFSFSGSSGGNNAVWTIYVCRIKKPESSDEYIGSRSEVVQPRPRHTTESSRSNKKSQSKSALFTKEPSRQLKSPIFVLQNSHLKLVESVLSVPYPT